MCKSHTFWTDNSHVCIRTNRWGGRGEGKEKLEEEEEKRSCCLPHFVSQYYLSSFIFHLFSIFFSFFSPFYIELPQHRFHLIIYSLFHWSISYFYLFLLSLVFVFVLTLHQQKRFGGALLELHKTKNKRKKKEKTR